MLLPSKLKHRKQPRPKARGKSLKGNQISFGDFGLKSLESKWITSRQIESSRRALTRHIKRGGQLWIRIFPDKPITTSAAESPMGGGKGSLDHFVAPIKKGRIIFELGGVAEDVAKEAMRLAAHKLPVKTKFISKD
jgi:large subunit ribosomal protein L16